MNAKRPLVPLLKRLQSHRHFRPSAVGRVLCRLVSLALLALACLTPARAQVSASITGIVCDASAAPVPSATIKAKNLETGAVRTAVTDGSGRYLLLSLPVGEYEVSVSKSGFQDAMRTGIQLAVNQEASVDLRLQVSAVKAEVTVRGDAPFVSTTTLDISGLVGERAIKKNYLSTGAATTCS